MDTNQDQEERDVRQTGGMSRSQNRRALSTGGYQTYSGMSILEERYRQRQRLGRELQELDREVEASDGYQFHSRISFLEKSFFIFDLNYLNLKHILGDFELNLRHILEGFEQPIVFFRLWEEKNRDRFNLYLNDVIRFFHNYLAGAMTLLDNIRTLQEDAYGGADPSGEYRTRWNQQFEDSSLTQFVEDLLTHMLYEGLPLGVAELSFGGVGSRVETNSVINIDVGKLGEWERWSEKGREYLNTLDNRVRLDHIVDEHAAVITDFYRWFVTRQFELHQGAIEELEELESRRQLLRQEISRLEGIAELAEKTPIAAVREELYEPVTAARREERDEPALAAREERDELAFAPREEQDEPVSNSTREELDETASISQEEEETPAEEPNETAIASREERDESAETTQERLDRLARELEAERQYREWDKGRADRLEAQLENELNKGFWRKLFGR